MAPPPKRQRGAGAPSLDGPSKGKAAEEPVKARAPPADDDASDEEVPEKRLRFVDVLTELPNGDAAAATELALASRGLTELETLESVNKLRKLELKGNYLTDLSFLEMNHQLCWLGVANNRLPRIVGLKNLASLAVLDLSDNRLTRLEGLEGLRGLKALIVARNRISRIEGLSAKKNPILETIVLSHNRITECQMEKLSFPKLKKLSLAQNRLHAFPSLGMLPELTELRLNGNRICTLTKDVAKQPRLSILDIGNNLLGKAESLESLRGLLWIKQLNLFGNPVAQNMEDNAVKGLLATMSRLEILNNRRVQQAGANGDKKKGRRSSGSRNGAAAAAAEVKVAPKVVAVHGRGFEGKRQTFGDDSDDDAAPRHGKSAGDGGSSGGKAGVEARPKKKLKKKKVLNKESASVAAPVKVAAVAAVAPKPVEAEKPRKLKKKLKRKVVA